MIKKNFKKKSKVLIFVLAYNAEKTISETINRLPLNSKDYDLEILIIDDASSDNTFIKAKNSKIKNNSNLKITILRNPVNQGFGGNVKIGFMYAIKNNFDMVWSVSESKKFKNIFPKLKKKNNFYSTPISQ